MKKFIETYGLLSLLLGASVFAFLCKDLIPLQGAHFFFTLSTVIKNILMFLLPFLVLPFIAKAILSFKKGGAFLVLWIVLGVAVSTFLAVCFSYSIAALVFPSLTLKSTAPVVSSDKICTLIDFTLDPFLSIEVALLIGILVGAVLSYVKYRPLLKFMHFYHEGSLFFFQKIFTPLLPLYIFGFLLKIAHDYDCAHIFETFEHLLMVIAAATLFYIVLYFWAGTGFRAKKIPVALRNTLPAWVSGFFSISSVLTMPITLRAAQKNVSRNKEIGDLGIPTTVNCHAIGDAISLPLIAFAIYFLTFQSLPNLDQFLHFAVMLTLAQFGAISVAGGSAIIIVPALMNHMSFSSEMVGLLTAIAIFLDPWGTGCNVTGNVGYAMIVDRLYGVFKKRPRTSQI